MALLFCPAALQAGVIFSPNGDGVKDAAVFRLSVADKPNLASWRFEIQDSVGKLLQVFSGAGAPPDELRWDGKDLNKRLVPDGTYKFILTIETRAGNKVAASPESLIVDRVDPTAVVSVEPKLFSPNGDGVKDEAIFKLTAQDANEVNSWLLTLKDKDGLAVKNWTGRAVAPATLSWDGKGDLEEDVPDGTYIFTLTVQDMAGNSKRTPLAEITLNRMALASEIMAGPRVFSPNGDGAKDVLSIDIKSADPQAVEGWMLEIFDRHGKAIKSFEGKGSPPVRLSWNGLTAKGVSEKDGSYGLVLTETDHAGNKARGLPFTVELDATPPLAEVRLEPSGISPNGDGVQEEGIFHLKIVEEHPVEEWRLTITNDVGRLVKQFKGSGSPASKISWRGEGEDGKTLLDGAYNYTLSARDIAGNEATTPPQPAKIDRTPPVVSLSIEPALFSPNGDRALDETTIQLKVEDANPLSEWRLEIKDSRARQVKTFSGVGEAPASLIWDGKNDERALLPDGGYAAVLFAQDTLGNKSQTPPKNVTIGATRPTVIVQADKEVFSPNADGIKDSVGFALSVKSFNALREWALKIQDSQNQILRTFVGRSSVPASLLWRGERDDKRMLLDGDYKYILEVVDEAGNQSASLSQPIRIDTTKPQIKAALAPSLFSPNGDGFKDEASFSLVYQDASPCAEWKIEIRDSAKSPVANFSGKEAPPASLSFSGKSPAGKILPDGSYTYQMTAVDIVGNRSVGDDLIFRVDTMPPKISLSINPSLFSPNADGDRDTTTYLLEFQDASDIEKYALSISGAETEKVFSGTGRPPMQFVWDGKSDRGSVVSDGRYTALASLRDEVGNEGKSPAVFVNVDISRPLLSVVAEEEPLETLVVQSPVMKTEAGLVISLAAEVLFDTGKDALKLSAHPTLLKTANLLKKHPNRKIRVEGHTDNVPIHNEEFPNNQALSEGRAKSIMKFFANAGGIPEGRMTAGGFGQTRPIAANATPEGRQKNRRVEIILLKE